MKSVGEAIKHFRIKHHVKTSQTTLGKAIGKKTDSAAQSIIKHYENNTRTVSQEDLLKILDYLGISEKEFVGFMEPEPIAPLIVNGEVMPPEFLEMWPEAPKYFAMYKQAVDLGLSDMERSVALDMAKNLRERADFFAKRAEQEELSSDKTKD